MKKKWRIIVLFILLIIGIGFIYSSYVYKEAISALDAIYEPINDDKKEERHEVKELEKEVDELFLKKNILLIGIDSWKIDKGRSDVLMVLSLDEEIGKAKMLSIPRDTYVDIIGKNKKDKINHSYSFGGTKMVVDTVERFLDIEINNYVLLNMDGFVKLIDVIGGIEVESKFAFEEEGVVIEKGENFLNGKEALVYVRMRNHDKNGDLGRNERQKQVIQTILSSSSKKLVMNFQGILNIVEDNIKTDLKTSEMKMLLSKREFVNGMEKEMLEGKGKKINGVWYFSIENDELQRIRGTMKNKK